MNDLGELKNALAEHLRADTALADIKIKPEYPAVRDYPLRKPLIAVGVDSVEMVGSLGGYLGQSETGGELYGSTCRITVRFDIFVPDNGTDPHGIMEKLCDALMISKNEFGFFKLWSEAARPGREAEGLRLSVKGDLTAAKARYGDGELASGIRVVLG